MAADSIRALCVSGEVGTGKSALAASLQVALLGWSRLNTGQRFREFCEKNGFTIQQVADLPDEVHRDFDNQQRDEIRRLSHVIVEGRLAGWLASDQKDVFRVFCGAPFDVRLDRYMQREGVSRERAIQEIRQRDQGDLDKFRHLYGIEDYRDPCYYSLVLDTSQKSPSELAEEILAQMRREEAKR